MQCLGDEYLYTRFQHIRNSTHIQYDGNQRHYKMKKMANQVHTVLRRSQTAGNTVQYYLEWTRLRFLITHLDRKLRSPPRSEIGRKGNAC